MNIQNAQVNQEIRFNYYGKTMRGTVTKIRPISGMRDGYYVSVKADDGNGYAVMTNFCGQGVAANEYQTAIVTFDDTPQARMAMEIITQACGGADAPQTKAVRACMAINS